MEATSLHRSSFKLGIGCASTRLDLGNEETLWLELCWNLEKSENLQKGDALAEFLLEFGEVEEFTREVCRSSKKCWIFNLLARTDTH
jgi:hypothetical protein